MNISKQETKKKNMVIKWVCSCPEHEDDRRYYVFPTEGHVCTCGHPKLL
jgi:hypothetical protein